MTKILCFAASLRAASLNKKLARAGAVTVEIQGAHAKVIDLRDFAMPIYDGDIESEHGVPAQADALAKEIIAHDALLIASPEYNGGPPAVLKNSLDWITRLGQKEGEPNGKSVLANKPTLLLSTSPGPMGGLRGTILARAMLSHLGLLVIPQTLAVGGGGQAFSPDGALADASRQAQLDSAVNQLIQAAGKK